MKHKVGDEVVLKGKIIQVDNGSIPYRIEFGEEHFWFSEGALEASRVRSSEERRKEIEEQIKALNKELESLK